MTEIDNGGEITLDTSKLLGFQTLASLDEGADLRVAMDDTHNKIGEPPGELIEA